MKYKIKLKLTKHNYIPTYINFINVTWNKSDNFCDSIYIKLRSRHT